MQTLRACRELGAWSTADDVVGRVVLAPDAPSLSHPWLSEHEVRQSAVWQAMTACLKARDGDGVPVAAALQAALRMLERAERRRAASPAAYGAAMQAHVLAGRRAAAVELYVRAASRGAPLSTVESKIAIGAAARCGQRDEALDLIGEMRRAADPLNLPDVGTYDAVLKCLAGAARYDEVVRLFEQMRDDGLSPLEIHFRQALGAHASTGNGPRAAELLLTMQDLGMNYSSAAADAMHACNRAGMPDVSLDIFEAVRLSVPDPRPAAAAPAEGALRRRARPTRRTSSTRAGPSTCGTSVGRCAAPPLDGRAVRRHAQQRLP